MRKILYSNGQALQRISDIEGKLIGIGYKITEHDEKIEEIFNEFEKNKKEEIKQKIFFEGQIWDSYSLIIDLIKKAKEKITIIDNYMDDSILKMLTKKNKNVEVNLLTSNKCNINKVDIQKFNKEYPTLKLAYTNKFHDRFIIIDNEELYHLRSIDKRFRSEMFCNK